MIASCPHRLRLKTVMHSLLQLFPRSMHKLAKSMQKMAFGYSSDLVFHGVNPSEVVASSAEPPRNRWFCPASELIGQDETFVQLLLDLRCAICGGANRRFGTGG